MAADVPPEAPERDGDPAGDGSSGIDPWSSQQYTDYARLRDEFGIEPVQPTLEKLPDLPPIFRRGVVFGQRGLDRILRAVKYDEPWAVLTGLMPSGRMHFGHKMVIDQVVYFESLGAEVFIGVADLESYATRGMSLEEGEEVALEEYVRNYLALGLDPDNAQVYFQSKRADVQRLAYLLGSRVNWSTFKALYGFDGETTMSHAQAPLVQAADILHPQLPKNGGSRPVLVPVGVDQDPHIRLARDLAAATRLFSIKETDKGLGIFIKADEEDANLHRVAKHLGIDDEAVVPELLDRAQGVAEELGFSDVEQNVGYRALYLRSAAERHRATLDVPLARLEQELGEMGFVAPSATYHRFISGLTGDKMSSSDPDSAIFLSEDVEAAHGKINRSVTGGRPTAEEQRELGADPHACPVFELYVYHLIPDDQELADIEERCSGGDLLCGHCKATAREKATELLEGHHAAREDLDDAIERLVRYD